jgi:hypothetical protein
MGVSENLKGVCLGEEEILGVLEGVGQGLLQSEWSGQDLALSKIK